MISGLFAIATLVAFVGVCIWAWSKRNQARFSEAAQLPLEEDPGTGDH